MRNTQLWLVPIIAAVLVTACAGASPAQRPRPEAGSPAAPTRPLVILSRGEPISLALRAFQTVGGGSYPHLVFNATFDDQDAQGNPVPVLPEALPQLNSEDWRVTPDGRMQVPNNGTDVGWYNFSAAPGLSGNAVLSGHVDTATSRTAVFTRLHELKLGDAISIVENGQKADFNVFWMRSWPDDTAPLNLILGNAPSPTLTLITCSGTFDRVTRNYTERLVVRAKLPGSV